MENFKKVNNIVSNNYDAHIELENNNLRAALPHLIIGDPMRNKIITILGLIDEVEEELLKRIVEENSTN